MGMIFYKNSHNGSHKNLTKGSRQGLEQPKVMSFTQLKRPLPIHTIPGFHGSRNSSSQTDMKLWEEHKTWLMILYFLLPWNYFN